MPSRRRQTHAQNDAADSLAVAGSSANNSGDVSLSTSGGSGSGSGLFVHQHQRITRSRALREHYEALTATSSSSTALAGSSTGVDESDNAAVPSSTGIRTTRGGTLALRSRTAAAASQPGAAPTKSFNAKAAVAAAKMLPQGIRCCCDFNFLNGQDLLVLCRSCWFWSHRKCCGMVGASPAALESFDCHLCSPSGPGSSQSNNKGAGNHTNHRGVLQQQQNSFWGNYYTSRASMLSGKAGAKKSGAALAAAAANDPPKVRLIEVPDTSPKPQTLVPLLKETLQQLVDHVRTLGGGAGYDVIFVPPLPDAFEVSRVGTFEHRSDVMAGAASDGNGESAANGNNTHTPSHNGGGVGGDSAGTLSRRLTRGAAKRSRSATPTTASQEHSMIAAPSTAAATTSGQDDAPQHHRRLAYCLPDSAVEEALDCCASAIRNATFSATYPEYCLRELQDFDQPYLQGVFFQCRARKRVVAFALSNGMDSYGNLKNTITSARNYAYRHGLITTRRGGGETIRSDDWETFAVSDDPMTSCPPPPEELVSGTPTTTTPRTATAVTTDEDASLDVDSSASEPPKPVCPRVTPFMMDLLEFGSDVSGFVHVSLVAAHEDFRGRGLAKCLMLADGLRWLLRGRTCAYINMALERRRLPNPPPLTPPPRSPVTVLQKKRNGTVAAPSVSAGSTTVAMPVTPAAATNSEAATIGRGTLRQTQHREDAVMQGPPTPVLPGRRALIGSKDTNNSSSSDNSDSDDDDASAADEVIVCAYSTASRKLYAAMGYRDVYPRFSPATGEPRWTEAEEDSGRVMATLALKESMRGAARAILGPDTPLFSNRKVIRLQRQSSR